MSLVASGIFIYFYCMGSAEKITQVTVQEYLDYLDSIEGRAEYYDGVIYDLASSSNEHSLMGVNICSELKSGLRNRPNPCRVYGPDAILAIDANSSVVMPDVHVVCGPQITSSQNHKLNTSAILVVEILSPSTSSYDRGKKFDNYRMVPNLLEYLIVEQSEPHVELLRRQPAGLWSFESYSSLSDIVELRSIELNLQLSSIYDLIVFEKPKLI